MLRVAPLAAGDKTTPGYVDNNDGHPKYVEETFDFVVNDIAYKKVDGGVEVAPWYWKWSPHSCSNHTDHVFAGTEYSNKDIVIPETVTYDNETYKVVGIGDSAFWNAVNYTVTMPENSDSFTYIGDAVFFQTTPKSEFVVKIPASVTVIGAKAFSENIGIEFSKESRLETIGDFAFQNNSKLTELTLPNTVTALGSGVFAGCDNLSGVAIPAGVTKINADTFDGYYSNGNVTFAEGSIFKLQDGILYDSETIIRVLELEETVVVPEGIKYINDDAFNVYDAQYRNQADNPKATILKSITLPESLVSIGDNAFRACISLSEIVIPENVTEIGKNAFGGCSGLTKAVVSGQITELQSTFNGCSSLKDITLPDSLKVIGSSTFAGCPITSFDFSNITEIGTTAFKGSGITEFTGAEQLTTIGTNAFQGCTDLKTVIISDGVTTLGNGAFSNCYSITTAVIPASVTKAGINAFKDAFAAEATVVMQGNEPPELGNNAFSQQGTVDLTIVVPTGSEANYAASNALKPFMTDEEGEVVKNQDYSLSVSDTLSVKEGETGALTVQYELPLGAELKFTSSDEKIVSVDKDGNVTGVLAGNATVTVSIEISGFVLVSDECTVTVQAKEVPNTAPVISAKDQTLTVGDKFNPLDGVTASDKEDGDLTKNIEVISNDVNTEKAGTYHVTYKVTDTQGASVEKTITVTVQEKSVTPDPDDTKKPDSGENHSGAGNSSGTDNKENVAETNQTSNGNTQNAGSTSKVATGDSQNPVLWVTLLAVSGLLVIIFMAVRHRKSTDKQ